jgi:tRNA-modifying protein YgfZ
VTDRLEKELFPRVVGSSAACLPLERAAFRAAGADRVRFLNGMLSNDVAALAPGRAQRALLLTRKGRILAELTVAAREQDLFLETAAGQLATALETLGRYIIADDVQLDPFTGLRALAIEGPGAAPVLTGAGFPAPAPGTCELVGDEVWLGGGGVTTEGVRVFAVPARLAEISTMLALPVLAPEHAELLRIEAFLPTYGVDMSEDHFPQEARLEQATVSFRKGCYIGQEIVARIASRGGVNKLLVQLRSAAEVAPGDEIRAEGRAIGNVTSAARLPDGGGLALGYVKLAHADPGSALEVGATTAVVVGPTR